VLIGGGWWAVVGGDRGSWLGLRLSSASWVIGKAPASAQQLGMSLGCSVMGERAVAASVLCGLCRKLKKFNTDVSPGAVPLLLCIFLPPRALLLSSHSKTYSPPPPSAYRLAFACE
jgi:hypothetical protein